MMRITLNAEMQTYVRRLIESGEFRDADSACEAALRRMKMQDDWISSEREAIGRKLDEARRSVERGEGAEPDVERLKTRARQVFSDRHETAG